MRRLWIAVAVIAAGASIYWMFAQRAATPTRQAAPDAWMALRIQAHPAGAEDDVLIEVTAYDRRARQASITREATGGRWGGSGAAATETARPLPEGWPGRLRLEANDSGASIPFTVASQRADGDAVLRIAAADAPPDGSTLVAVLNYEAGDARSNAASIARAPATAVERLVALGWQAALTSDAERMMAAGEAIVAADDASPWAHYFTGLAHETRGEKAEALAAFRRALARVDPGYEPPAGLVAHINRLRQ